MRGAVLRREAVPSRSVGPVLRRAWRCPRAPLPLRGFSSASCRCLGSCMCDRVSSPMSRGWSCWQLGAPVCSGSFSTLSLGRQVIPEDLSLPNSGADASPSLFWCRTPAFQDPFPTGGNEGFSSPFSLGLACCRCVSPVERASNRRGVLLAISG